MPKTSEAWPIFEDDPFVGFEQLDVTTLGRFKNILKKGGPMQDSTPADDAGPRFLQLDINGMHCMNCVVAVERSLKDAPGVQSVRASYPPGRAVIGYREEMNLQGVYNALEAQGYNVKAVNFVDDPTPPEGDDNHLGIAAAFLIPHWRCVRASALSGPAAKLQCERSVELRARFPDRAGCVCLELPPRYRRLPGGAAAKYNEANQYLTDQ
jgi:copper chaperone CopZ